MTQNIRHLRALAHHAGLTFAEFVRRRFREDAPDFDAVSRDGVTVTTKPKTYGDLRLPDNYQILTRTIYE